MGTRKAKNPQACSHGARTCSYSAAWTCIRSTRLLLTTSALMQRAKHIGQRTRGKTQSGSPIVQQRKPLESITSRNPKTTSNASRQLNVELAVVNFCMRSTAPRDNECFTVSEAAPAVDVNRLLIGINSKTDLVALFWRKSTK